MTLFSGGELVGVGARMAGLTHLTGIEYDNDISNVARLNGFASITADVMTIDPHTLEVPDVLHASPVCKRASLINNQKGKEKETQEDIAMGEKIAQFIDVMTPRIVTVENVYSYRNFAAFNIICAALDRNGYFWDYDNLNSANFGVPQARERLILRAVKGSLLPMLPQVKRQIGWMEATEDLIPSLDPWQLANWQKKILPPGKPILLIGNNQGGDERLRLSCATPDKPAFTITVSNAPKNRILINGKVLRPNIQFLARLQSLPDSYIFPDNSQVSHIVLGNGVPCKLYEAIIRDLTQSYKGQP
jgi:DNA (cytosine-5)-methyltransferase 1